MFLRPDLVSPAVADAPAVTGTSFADLVRLAGAPAWAGYFGSPRLGSAALGAQSLALNRELLVSLASRILEGWDPAAERRYVAAMGADPPYVELDRGLEAEEQRRGQRQRDWLARRKR